MQLVKEMAKKVVENVERIAVSAKTQIVYYDENRKKIIVRLLSETSMKEIALDPDDLRRRDPASGELFTTQKDLPKAEGITPRALNIRACVREQKSV